jgi:hypothetical protein
MNRTKIEVLIIKSTTLTGGIFVNAGEVWDVTAQEWDILKIYRLGVKAEEAQYFKHTEPPSDHLIDTRKGQLKPGDPKPEIRKPLRSLALPVAKR